MCTGTLWSARREQPLVTLDDLAERIRVALALTMLAGCGRIRFDAVLDGGGDGSVACTSWTSWSVPQRISELASPENDFGPALAGDGRTVVFNRCDVDDSNCSLVIATWQDATSTWSTPQLISTLDTGASTQDGAWDAAGTRLYFGESTGNMLVSAYGGAAFGPGNIVAGLPNEAFAATLSSDELEMFYTLNMSMTQNLIARATRTSIGDPWTDQGAVPELALSNDTGWPSLSSDGLTIYVEDDNDGPGPVQIYVATRTAIGGMFTPPMQVPELDASNAGNGDPEISRDGTTMLFSSDRAGGAGLADIYRATRTCR